MLPTERLTPPPEEAWPPPPTASGACPAASLQPGSAPSPRAGKPFPFPRVRPMGLPRATRARPGPWLSLSSPSPGGVRPRVSAARWVWALPGYLPHDLPAVEHHFVSLPEPVLGGGLHLSCKGAKWPPEPLPPQCWEEGQRASRLTRPPRGPRDGRRPGRDWRKCGQMQTLWGPRAQRCLHSQRSPPKAAGAGEGPDGRSQELGTRGKSPDLPVPPRAGVGSHGLTLPVKPPAHKKDGDAHKGQGQEGSDRHPR